MPSSTSRALSSWRLAAVIPVAAGPASLRCEVYPNWVQSPSGTDTAARGLAALDAVDPAAARWHCRSRLATRPRKRRRPRRRKRSPPRGHAPRGSQRRQELVQCLPEGLQRARSHRRDGRRERVGHGLPHGEHVVDYRGDGWRRGRRGRWGRSLLWWRSRMHRGRDHTAAAAADMRPAATAGVRSAAARAGAGRGAGAAGARGVLEATSVGAAGDLAPAGTTGSAGAAATGVAGPPNCEAAAGTAGPEMSWPSALNAPKPPPSASTASAAIIVAGASSATPHAP